MASTIELVVDDAPAATLLDEKVRSSCKSDKPISQLNLPKSEEYIVNSRNQKLHVRSFLPDDKNVTMLVIYLHGYSAHNNQPWMPVLAKEFTDQNIGLISFDFHGHGYSDGFPVHVEKHEDLVDDCLCLISELYFTAKSGGSGGKGILLQRGFSCPFVICGQSLGGVVTIATGLELQYIKEKTSKNTYSDAFTSIAELFKGCVILCPAISLDLPPQIVLSFLEHCVLPVVPRVKIPSCIAQPPLDREVVFHEDYFDYVGKDNITSDPPGMVWVSHCLCKQFSFLFHSVFMY